MLMSMTKRNEYSQEWIVEHSSAPNELERDKNSIDIIDIQDQVFAQTLV